MPNMKKLAIVFATGAMLFAAMYFTTFAQAPAAPPLPGAPAATAPIPAILQNYPAVTAERLKTPEPGSWLMVRRTYDG